MVRDRYYHTSRLRTNQGRNGIVSRVPGHGGLPPTPMTTTALRPFSSRATTTRRGVANTAIEDADEASQSAIEREFQRKTPLEHVLLRPGMYVGNTEHVTEEVWTITTSSSSKSKKGKKKKTKENLRGQGGVGRVGGGLVESGPLSPLHGFVATRQQRTYVPSLYKIFDEILVNAIDNLQRSRGDHAMTRIRVDIEMDGGRGGGGAGGGAGGGRGSLSSPSSPRITVWNDGRGIPVRMHRSEKMWIPELVFGHLLTGSNFGAGGSEATGETQSSVLTGGQVRAEREHGRGILVWQAVTRSEIVIY